VLADDALALIRHLGLGAGEYDLAGYSLGGRIVVRMLARGAEPGRAVVAGQGLAKIAGPQGGGANRRALTALADGIALPSDSAGAQIAHWAAELGADPRALLCVLGSLVPHAQGRPAPDHDPDARRDRRPGRALGRRRTGRAAARRALRPRARRPWGRVRSA
jgi:pimeloyl-ACP methyl ester carboxylesterase